MYLSFFRFLLKKKIQSHEMEPDDWRLIHGSFLSNFSILGLIDMVRATLESFPVLLLALISDAAALTSQTLLFHSIRDSKPINCNRMTTTTTQRKGFSVSQIKINLERSDVSSQLSIEPRTELRNTMRQTHKKEKTHNEHSSITICQYKVSRFFELNICRLLCVLYLSCELLMLHLLGSCLPIFVFAL